MYKNTTIIFIFLGLINISIASSLPYDKKKISENCKLVQDNLLRHAIKIIHAYENQQYSRSFVETIKMSKLIPHTIQECELVEYQLQSKENQSSQKLLSEIYSISKEIAKNPQDQTALLYFGKKLIFTIELLHENGLDESSHDISQSDDSWDCVICAALLRLGWDDADYKKQDIATYMSTQFCKLFPKEMNSTCNKFLDLIGPYLIEAASHHYNSDVICAKIGACNGKYLQCHINGSSNPNPQSRKVESILSQFKKQSSFQSPWKWIIELIKGFADEHTPVVDLDKDGFSTIPTLRGYNWRGKDCNDFDQRVHPGVKIFSGDQTIDYNCNDIQGVDTVSGKPYKEILCSGTEQYGIITMGDSAGAHFEIPPAYLNVTLWDDKPFKDIFDRISNEFDLPQMSGTTGYKFTEPNVNSIYKKLLELNRCVNGASSKDTLKNIVKSISRNQTTDNPVFMVFELIGNDVCDPAHSFNAMTDPTVFREKILELWNYLDSTIPAGSHMIIWGVADGRILYETLKEKLEPIGISYPNFYDYLNCLGLSPCWGYMNTDSNTRDLTANWAASLNQVYKDLLADPTIKFKNFDIVYYDLPILEIIQRGVADGYTAQDIIEPVDGFHPSQLANDYLADIFWDKITIDRPHWIPKPNPNNQLIDSLFGNPFDKQTTSQQKQY